MKINSKKHKGFTLLEIVISMAILAIISATVYDGFMIMIKQIKAGQVKQTAALEGKKVIEEINAATESGSFTFKAGEDLELSDNIEVKGSSDSSLSGKVLFDKDGKVCAEENKEYTATIKLERTKTSEGHYVKINSNQVSDLESADNYYKLYIGKEGSEDYITDTLESEDSKIDLVSESDLDSKKIIISMYLQNTNEESKENIKKCGNEGKNLLEITKYIDKSLIINFSKYKKEDGSVPSNVEIETNIYNETTNVSNIYIQKTTDLDAEIKIHKGIINVYNNRAEEEAEIGALYDITVNVTNKHGDTLFTGYSKQNIVWKENS